VSPKRPHLIAVDGEGAHERASESAAPRRGGRLSPWLAALLIVAAVAGWWLYLRTSDELRDTRAELARAQARVFSLESRMMQVRRGASALATTLAAAEEQARALEALATGERAGGRMGRDAAAELEVKQPSPQPPPRP
jgi:hypothetical protein